MEKEKTDKFMQQQNDMLTAILEMQRQQNNWVQASHADGFNAATAATIKGKH